MKAFADIIAGIFAAIFQSLLAWRDKHPDKAEDVPTSTKHKELHDRLTSTLPGRKRPDPRDGGL